MSTKKIYEVTSAVDLLIKPFDTVLLPTNLSIKVEDNELVFFRIEESLYRKHGLISLEPLIEEKDHSVLTLKISKICMIQLANMGDAGLREKIFGVGNEFKIKENMVVGNLTVLVL